MLSILYLMQCGGCMPLFHLLIYIAAGAVCAIIIDYLADVLPETRTLSKPVCKNCGHPFSAADYLLARRCSHCKEKRSSKWIIYLCSMLFSAIVFLLPLAGLPLWAVIPLQIFLGTILVIDYEHRVVLIQTTLFGLILFFIYGFALNDLSATLLGGLAGLLIMLVFYFLGILFSKVVAIMRKKQIDEVAFGFGDVCLGTVLGLLTGWPGIAAAIIVCMFGFVTFSFIYVAVMIIFKQYRAFSTTLPFTFFLVFGAMVILFF